MAVSARPLRILLAFALAILHGGDALADAIARSERVAVGGAELYVETRGADPRAPLVLWLHGGPGGAERPLFRYFEGDLERDFLVAYLDQRGAGRSFDPEADPHVLTIARHLADLDAVVDHLLRRVGASKLVLLGHSWGSALGLLYARDHPEKVAAFVGVAPLVSMREAAQSEWAFVSAEAERRGDRDAQERLREIGPPPYASAREALAVERIAAGYGALYHIPPNQTRVIVSGILRGLVLPWEIPHFIRGNDVSLDAMHAELDALDLFRSVPSVDVPVFFLLGRWDRHIDARIAARYFEVLRAPRKELVWFEGSAHNPPFEEADRFVAVVRDALRSIGIGAPTPSNRAESKSNAS